MMTVSGGGSLPCCLALFVNSSSKSVLRMVGGSEAVTSSSSSPSEMVAMFFLASRLGMILSGTTPSMQDGRRIALGEPGGELTSIVSCGDDVLRWSSSSEDDNSSLFCDVRFRLKLRCRDTQPFAPPVFTSFVISLCLPRFHRSGSLDHFSRVMRKVFLRMYFLLCTYLEIAEAQFSLPVNFAHSSAHKLRPWSLRFGLAPGKYIHRLALIDIHL